MRARLRRRVRGSGSSNSNARWTRMSFGEVLVVDDWRHALFLPGQLHTATGEARQPSNRDGRRSGRRGGLFGPLREGYGVGVLNQSGASAAIGRVACTMTE